MYDLAIQIAVQAKTNDNPPDVPAFSSTPARLKEAKQNKEGFRGRVAGEWSRSVDVASELLLAGA